MCIDDRPHLLRLRETLLEKHGYIVVAANSAAAAIAKLENCAIDAALLEYKSEGMDAEAIAFQIKQRFPNQPVVLLSAYSEMPERVLWLVDEYVMKSEPVEGLVQAIERAIRAREEDYKPCRGRVVAFNAKRGSVGESGGIRKTAK
ncbi:MAG: response regulator [Terriglobales bacterium]